MDIAPQISKEFVEDEKCVQYKEKFKTVLTAGYHNVNIEVFQCPIHSNEFFIEAAALGVRLSLLYWVNSMSISIEEILDEVYKDFGVFVLAIRDEEHATKH